MFRVWGFGSGVSGLGFGVWGSDLDLDAVAISHFSLLPSFSRSLSFPPSFSISHPPIHPPESGCGSTCRPPGGLPEAHIVVHSVDYDSQ